MSRENLKLVSCRIDPEALRRIDNFIAKRSYWKRNAVINQIVTNVTKLMDERQLYDLIRYSDYSRDKWKLTFEKESNEA